MVEFHKMSTTCMCRTQVLYKQTEQNIGYYAVPSKAYRRQQCYGFNCFTLGLNQA